MADVTTPPAASTGSPLSEADLFADPTATARTAAAEIAAATGVEHHDAAIVLGSGWVPAADLLGQTVAEVPISSITGFAAPSVAGHAGLLRSVRAGDVRLLVFLGRTHYYEGRGVDAVAHGVRTAAAAGVRTVVLTNGCGGLDPTWTPGTPVLIADHINLTGRTPLLGTNDDRLGPRFPDMSAAYSPRLRELARSVDPDLEEAVYAGFLGPTYETPAEVRMAATLGGELVGMSTVLETIAATHAGAEVLAVSLVTNLAAGLSDVQLDHDDVLAVAAGSAERMGALIAEIVGRI